MRPPSENFRNKLSTFHSMSVGGRLVGLLKKISYSIFSRRNCESRMFNSSSVVTGISKHSLRIHHIKWEIPPGHVSAWYESKAVAKQEQNKGNCGGRVYRKGNRRERAISRNSRPSSLPWPAPVCGRCRSDWWSTGESD